ncbi:hypothetical protein PARHAE_03757 [Paracoccus haematequi]|uniref:T6SS Transcription factor RovC-like DNA binding domain-containing protein n=1 Tax=Paracoccus haematequi TaxID=2491866 RepID=A0A3S5D4B1_9RHOB|nr:DUF2285 domain-containing protein [Paracoccus haematequi]VDS10541.1 hypothetical protein PARHAE_03757 [Paracoccus haematequi]
MAADLQAPLWSPRLNGNAFMLLPIARIIDASGPTIKLAHLDGIDLRHTVDGWHGIWRADGIAHQLWLPQAGLDAAAFYGTFLPLDAFYELRSHAAQRFWRSIEGRRPGPDFRVMPAQLRQWHILSLRALDARMHGESYRTIAAELLGFRGTKQDWEVDPRKNKARRLVAHGIKMMSGGYRLLLHYPIKADGRHFYRLS